MAVETDDVQAVATAAVDRLTGAGI